MHSVQLPGLTLTTLQPNKASSLFDLTLTMWDNEQGMRGYLEYNTDLFSDATMARFVAHFQQLMAAIAAQPGMMDCKKPLVEANGDFEAAIEYLRKKEQTVAANRADRTATEGAAIGKTNAEGTKGVALVVGCETDFVAKNEDFVAFAHSVADAALANMPADLDALLNLSVDGVTIADRLTEQVGKIGEKIEVSQYNTLEARGVIAYIHAGNRIGVLVAVNKAKTQVIEEVGKDVAMQTAAMKPVALDEDSVPQNVIDKELEIGREQALAEGKPENMVDKISTRQVEKIFHRQYVAKPTIC